MKYFKKLQGKICYLSPISMDDTEKYTEWLNDIDVIKHLQLVNQNITLHSEKEAIERLMKGHNYAIVSNDLNELIGNCGLMNIDQLNRTAETGIFIGDKQYWNKGYGTEALNLLIDYGFRFLNLRNIMLNVYSFNERAVACYRKCGFMEIGRRRKALIRDLEVHDIIFMDILAEDVIVKDKQ